MPTKQARVHTVLEPPLFELVDLLARRDGVSRSQKVRDLVAEALETLEDIGLEAIATERMKSKNRRWLTHDEAWKRLGHS